MIFNPYRTDACFSFGFEDNSSSLGDSSQNSSWTESYYVSCLCWSAKIYTNNRYPDCNFTGVYR